MTEPGPGIEARRTAVLWRYWAPVAAYAALIFYLSSFPHPETVVPSFLEDLGDKVLHGLEYAVLGALCYRAFRHGAGPRAARLPLKLAIAASAAYGLSDEVHQAFVPLRHPDVWDVAMDAVGSTLGAVLWRVISEPARLSNGHHA